MKPKQTKKIDFTDLNIMIDNIDKPLNELNEDLVINLQIDVNINKASNILSKIRYNYITKVNQILIRTSSYSIHIFSININLIIIITVNAFIDLKITLSVKIE